jgi:glycosyltransferase involved in cell wall biosynthesis
VTSRKICILTETYYPVVGGGETQARALAEGLVAHGFGVLVLTRRSHASFKKVERLGEVTVYRLPPVGSEHLKKWGLLLTTLSALIKLRRQYDLIFVSGFRIVGISAVLVSKLLGKTCVLKADSQGEMSGKFFANGLAQLRLETSFLPFRIFLALRNRVLRGADAFVAISSEAAAELEAGGIKPMCIRSIPNSVDTSRFRPASGHEKQELRQKLGISQQDKVVIFTGRLVSYKGLFLLVRVWQEIQRNHANVRLLIVGSGGLDIHDCEASLKWFVSTNGLHGSVEFTGSVDNVYDYLRASDIFAFPTQNEAFGISLIEGMACGLPVVSTPVGGVNDILRNEHNGLVVAVDHFQQLYQALDTLLTDHALSSGLGRAARQTVQERYSAKNVTQQYVELFTQVISSGTRGLSGPNKSVCALDSERG